MKAKVTRREARKHLEQFHLAVELVKVIKHFFPDLIRLLKQTEDPRNQSYITYPNVILLMTRILSSIFYISSMRKTSQKFNSDTVIQNVWEICGESASADEIPYWETINKYLERLDPKELQDTVCQLVCRLVRSRSFADARIRDKYWQIIVDGTQIHSSRRKLDEKSLYRVHNKGTDREYTEYYYYVLEAKIVLHPDILVSIMTEFVENTDGEEAEKQDCERKACYRLMERFKKEFPRLPACFCADSLYACENFFARCRSNGWRYILRYKEGSIPTVADEYGRLKKTEKNRREQELRDGSCWHDFVTDIDDNGHKVNIAEYGEERNVEIKKGSRKGETENVKTRFLFLTDFPVNQKNVSALAEAGRRRWKIENEGFKAQKRHGYFLEHLYSRNYQALKNHYYLIQIGHMISQVMEAWEKLWKKAALSLSEKHSRIFESFQSVKLSEYRHETGKRFQIRFQ